MPSTRNTISNSLTLDEALARLAAAEVVDGLALFGSLAAGSDDPVSDYDLLILVNSLPIGIFQMLTHIDHRLTDVVFVQTEAIDQWLANPQPAADNSANGRLLLKLHKAQIAYDASGRLGRAQALALGDAPPGGWLLPSTYAAQYAAWFWKNFGLLQIKRMARSEDPVYLTAADLMLATGLSETCRDYCTLRHIPWEGEKAALRLLQARDPGCLALLRACLSSPERATRIQLYQQLVAEVLAPVGPVWVPGLTAVLLDSPVGTPAQLATALEFWESLITI